MDLGLLRRLDRALSGALIGFLAGIGGSVEQKTRILTQRGREAGLESPEERPFVNFPEGSLTG